MQNQRSLQELPQLKTKKDKIKTALQELMNDSPSSIMLLKEQGIEPSFFTKKIDTSFDGPQHMKKQILQIREQNLEKVQNKILKELLYRKKQIQEKSESKQYSVTDQSFNYQSMSPLDKAAFNSKKKIEQKKRELQIKKNEILNRSQIQQEAEIKKVNAEIVLAQQDYKKQQKQLQLKQINSDKYNQIKEFLQIKQQTQRQKRQDYFQLQNEYSIMTQNSKQIQMSNKHQLQNERYIQILDKVKKRNMSQQEQIEKNYDMKYQKTIQRLQDKKSLNVSKLSTSSNNYRAIQEEAYKKKEEDIMKESYYTLLRQNQIQQNICNHFHQRSQDKKNQNVEKFQRSYQLIDEINQEKNQRIYQLNNRANQKQKKLLEFEVTLSKFSNKNPIKFLLVKKLKIQDIYKSKNKETLIKDKFNINKNLYMTLLKEKSLKAQNKMIKKFNVQGSFYYQLRKIIQKEKNQLSQLEKELQSFKIEQESKQEESKNHLLKFQMLNIKNIPQTQIQAQQSAKKQKPQTLKQSIKQYIKKRLKFLLQQLTIQMNQFIRKFSDYFPHRASKKDSNQKNDSSISQPKLDEQIFVQNILQKTQSQKKETPLINYFLCNGQQDFQDQIEQERINKTFQEKSNSEQKQNNNQSMISNDTQNKQKQEENDNKQVIFASFNVKQQNENNVKHNRENQSKTSGEMYSKIIQQNKQKQDINQENDLISWNEQNKKNKKSYEMNIRQNSQDFSNKNDVSSEYRSQNQQFKLQTFSELQANKKKLSQTESQIEKSSNIQKDNQSISNNSNLTSLISTNQQVQNKQDIANIQNINLQEKDDYDRLQSQETELQMIKNCNSLVRKSQFYYNYQKSPNQMQQRMSKSPSDINYFSQQQFQNQRQSLMIQQKLIMQSKQQTTCTDQNDNASEKRSSQQSLQAIQEIKQDYQTQQTQQNQQSKIQVNDFKTNYQKQRESLKSPIRRSIFQLTPTQNNNLQRGSIFNQSSSRLQDKSISPSGYSTNQNQISPINNSILTSNSKISQKQTSTNFNQQYKRKINNSKINENTQEFRRMEIQIPQDSTQNIKSPIIKQLDFQEQYKNFNQIDINEKKQQNDQILKPNSPLDQQIANNQTYIQKALQRHSVQDNIQQVQLNNLIKEQQSEDSNEYSSQNSKFKNIKNIENIKYKQKQVPSKNESIDKKDNDDSEITNQKKLSRRVTISLDKNSSQISIGNKDQYKGILKNNSEVREKLNGSQDRFYQPEINEEFKKRVSVCRKLLHDKGKMTKTIDPEFILQKANINGLKYFELDEFIIKQISR